ncbi:hypothetical protein RZS08_08660, partial [Arthrospira platensis SPKY1]|nr:hypothetical protein [Arthrospira platensis SPKY1]
MKGKPARPGEVNVFRGRHPGSVCQSRIGIEAGRACSQDECAEITNEGVFAAPRFADRQGFAGAGHRDVEQTTLLVGTLCPCAAIEKEDVIELHALRAMRGHQHHRPIRSVTRHAAVTVSKVVDAIDQVEYDALAARCSRFA